MRIKGRQVAIIHWRDAALHGTEQMRGSEWKQETGLVSGIAAGVVLNETKDHITLAMDCFPADGRLIHEDNYRVTSSYPKSGIYRIQRLPIERKRKKK